MKEVAQVMFGSQNYFLDGPDSDYDYKILMMPEFNDFYTYHKVDKYDLPTEYDPEHYGVMGVLKYDENLRKGNINVLEMLFSREVIYNECLELYFQSARRAYEQGYVFSVWDSFIATIEGMIKNSLDRYGINRKSVSRVRFLLDFCYYVANHDFEIGYHTWELVSTSAREMRFNENVTLPTKEELFADFEDIKLFANDMRNYHRLMNSQSELDIVASWNDDLANCMRNIVKNELRKEL